MILALTHPECKGKLLEGLVKYNEFECRLTPADLDPDFKGRVRQVADELSNPEPPSRTPSALECNTCDISRDDCPERIESEAILRELELDPFA